MTIENEELSDDQLFSAAVDDAPETPEIAAAVIEQPEKPAGEVVAGSEQPDRPAVDDNAPLVPSWRLREINEEKRVLADRVKALEAEKLTPPRPQAEPPKAADKQARPDPLLDPDGYAAAIRQELRDEALADRREESLVRARDSNPEEFGEAYKAAQQTVDPALKARMQASRDPGKTLLEWHRESKARAEVGTDLNAYKAKLREEALKDPEFRKAAMEAWRADAQTQADGRPLIDMGRAKPIISPSLHGSSRANAALKSANEDVSDHELFAEITG